MVHRPQSAGNMRSSPRFIRNAFPTAPRRPGTAHAPRPGIDPSHCFQFNHQGAATTHDEHRQTTSKPSKHYITSFDFNKCLSRDEGVVEGRKPYESYKQAPAAAVELAPDITTTTTLDAMYIDRSRPHFVSTSSVPSYRLRSTYFDKNINREQRSKTDRGATTLTRGDGSCSASSSSASPRASDEHHSYSTATTAATKPTTEFNFVVVGGAADAVRSRRIVTSMERQSGRTHHNSIMFDIQGNKRTAGASSSSSLADALAGGIAFGASSGEDYSGRFQLPFHNISYKCLDRNVAIPQFQSASQLSAKQKQLRDETLRKTTEATGKFGGSGDAAAAHTPAKAGAAAITDDQNDQNDKYRLVDRRPRGALDFSKLSGKSGHINGARPKSDPQLTTGGWAPSFTTQERKLQNINIGKSSPRKPPSIGRKFTDIQLNPKFHLVEKTVLTPRIPPVPSGGYEHAHRPPSSAAAGTATGSPARAEHHRHHPQHHHHSLRAHSAAGSRPTSAASARSTSVFGVNRSAPSCSYTLDLDIAKADNIVHPRAIRNIRFAPSDDGHKKREAGDGDDSSLLFATAACTGTTS